MLDLASDPADLTATLVDFPSESHQEGPLADLVEATLRAVPHLDVARVGNTVIARTDNGRAERVLLGGHLDTVPSAGNLPHRLVGDRLYGLGACDMKGGVAASLHVAAAVAAPRRDVTYVYYDCEEVASQYNGLQKVLDEQPHLLAADLAILMEPSNAGVEAGCQGTLRARVDIPGTRAHSARSWMGVNAIHGASDALARLRDYEPRQPMVDGLRYREGLQAVGISGGVATNIIPDGCTITVNYRFAPDRTVDEAFAHVCEVLDGYAVTLEDSAPPARPGLDRAAAADFVAHVGATPQPKYGWTDVARFSSLGVPALNFGPGDPSLAHSRDENVPVEEVRRVARLLVDWLS